MARGFPTLHRYRQSGQPLLVKARVRNEVIAALKLGVVKLRSPLTGQADLHVLHPIVIGRFSFNAEKAWNIAHGEAASTPTSNGCSSRLPCLGR